MEELEAERKALLAQTQRIAEETRLAKENLDKANADYAAVKKEAQEKSDKVDEAVKAVRETGLPEDDEDETEAAEEI